MTKTGVGVVVLKREVVPWLAAGVAAQPEHQVHVITAARVQRTRQWLRQNMQSGDVVLSQISRGMGQDVVADGLLKDLPEGSIREDHTK
jgi:hypothetical protein